MNIHGANSIASSHERRPAHPFTEESLAGGAAADLAALEGAGGSDDQLFTDLLGAGPDAFGGLPDISESGPWATGASDAHARGGPDADASASDGFLGDGGEGAAVGGERGTEQERGLEQRQGDGAEIQRRVPARREARREPRAERELEQREEAEARQGEPKARGQLGELERVVERARRVPARGRAGDEEPLEGVLHARHVQELSLIHI